MDYTQHYNLKKPAYGEAVDVKDINDNADITDAQLNTLAELVAARLLKTDLITQIINDPNKIASMAALYSVNEAVKKVNSDLATKVTNESSDSHAIALGFGSLGRTNIKVDNTLRTLPVNSGTNYDIAFMEMTVNPNTNKRALKLTWQADGKTYNSYIETDKSDI